MDVRALGSLKNRMLSLFVSMLALGIVHGLGPDHCLAVSALAARGEHGQVLRTATRFGLAHAAVLLGFAAALFGLGWTLPERYARAGEVANGVLLVLLGAGLVLERLGRGLTAHVHVHRHGGTLHTHAHTHALKRPALLVPASPEALRLQPTTVHARQHHAHGHSRSAWAVGGLFALSGVRNAAMALPLALQGRPAQAFAGLAFFGLGVIGAMSGYGLVFGFAQRQAAARGVGERTMRIALGLAAATLGGYWIATA
jgi:ABC-type nickel/cobalt efflux system permease component RcnA